MDELEIRRRVETWERQVVERVYRAEEHIVSNAVGASRIRREYFNPLGAAVGASEFLAPRNADPHDWRFRILVYVEVLPISTLSSRTEHYLEGFTPNVPTRVEHPRMDVGMQKGLRDFFADVITGNAGVPVQVVMDPSKPPGHFQKDPDLGEHAYRVSPIMIDVTAAFADGLTKAKKIQQERPLPSLPGTGLRRKLDIK